MSAARWALLGSLYITQYLGTSFFFTALVAILRASGVALEIVGVVYLLGLVWGLKLLWAPWVDRWQSRRLGHFRAWLIAMQSLMILSLLAIGRLHPVHDFWTVYGLCLVLALASATQDVATDGLACRLALPQERGMVNGLQTAGSLLGNLLGAGAVLMAYPYVGWDGCTLILAAGTAVTLLQVLWFKEPMHPQRAGEGAKVLKRLWALVLRPGQRFWLALILLYPLATSLSHALITPMLVDAGWAPGRIGLTVNVVGSLCGIPAALLSGRLIRRYGVRPMLIGTALLQIPGVLVLIVPLSGATGALPVGLAVGLFFFFCYGSAMTVMTTMMMARCDVRSPATDYAVQFSLYILFGIVATTLGMVAAGQFGYLAVLGLAAICALAMVLLALVHSGAAGLPRLVSRRPVGSGADSQ